MKKVRRLGDFGFGLCFAILKERHPKEEIAEKMKKNEVIAHSDTDLPHSAKSPNTATLAVKVFYKYAIPKFWWFQHWHA